MLKLKLQYFGHLMPKSWLIGKDSDAGRDWGQEEKGTTEDEMAGWHHRLDGQEFGWTLGVGDGQGGLVCCNSWGHKESDTTERLNWTELMAALASQWKSWIAGTDHMASKTKTIYHLAFYRKNLLNLCSRTMSGMVDTCKPLHCIYNEYILFLFIAV